LRPHGGILWDERPPVTRHYYAMINREDELPIEDEDSNFMASSKLSLTKIKQTINYTIL